MNVLIIFELYDFELHGLYRRVEFLLRIFYFNHVVWMSISKPVFYS